MKVKCRHLKKIKNPTPSSRVCEDCVKDGDKWEYLRICMTCGYVGCCDASKNTHARKHFEATGHPIVKSLEPGEDWMWCFVDRVYIPSKK